MPTSLSPYPNVEQLRKQAKDLRKAHAAESPEAVKRLRSYVRGWAEHSTEEVLAEELTLRDAQHVIAREHGFGGWQELLQAAGKRSQPASRLVPTDSIGYTDDDLVPVRLLQVQDLERADGEGMSSVVLIGEDDRIITLGIGGAEGMALFASLRGEEFPRPLTPDLFSDCLRHLGGVVARTVIHELRDSVYLAHAILEVHGERKCFDARPSDCLNLALRQNAPVFVTRSLWEEVGKPLSDLPGHLETMRASLRKRA